MSNELLNWERAKKAGLSQSSSLVVVDIGGTRVKLGGICEGVPIDPIEQLYVEDIRHGNIINNLAQCIEDFRNRNALRLDGTVVTVPGFIGTDFDRILRCDNVKELQGMLLGSTLNKVLKVPIVLERDTILLLKGEHAAGSAKNQDNVAGVFIGTGIGASFLESGSPFRGNGWALELGHIPVWPVYHDRKKTHGLTLENISSGAKLRQFAQKYEVPIENLFRCASGNSDLESELDLVISYHAFSASVMISTFSPKMILFGGGVVELAGYPFERLKRQISLQIPNTDLETITEIQKASLGWKSVLQGTIAFLQPSKGD